jgi:hypothetical protein
MTKYKFFGIGIIILIVLIYGGRYLFVKASDIKSKLDLGLMADLPPLHLISPEDSSLIKSSYLGKLSAGQIYRSKIRQSISFINYDSSYNIIVFKILTAENFIFNNNLRVVKKTSDRTVMEAYGQHDYKNYYTFYLHSVSVGSAGQILMKISTDSLAMTVRNDSVVCYSVVCKNLSILYGESEPVDIFMEGNELGLGNNIEMHLNILFLKRKNAVFMIIMSPDRPDVSIDSSLLYNIIAR